MPGRVEFSFGPQRRSARTDGNTVCRILILADLVGETLRPPIAERQPMRVSAATLDALMARLAPRLELAAGSGLPALTIDFASLDDLHPDQLLARVPLFADIDASARRLAVQPQAAPPVPAGQPASPADDFAALLGGSVGRSAAGSDMQQKAEDFVRRLLAGTSSATPVPDPRQTVLDAACALARTQALRALLHHPDFQRLESAWRSLAMLVAGVDNDAGVEVWVLDIGRCELCADLAADLPILANLILQSAEQTGEWGLLVSTETFGASAEDVTVLAAFGAIAGDCGATVLAGMDPAITIDPAGFAADAISAARWSAVRALVGSNRIALAAPRLLLRRPYGARSDPLSSAAFEEVDACPAHEDFLWGSGGVGLALLLGQAWEQNEGWEFDPDQWRELDDLPMALLARNGERELVPCAERWLSDVAAQTLDGLGATVLLSRRDRNQASVLRFRSLAGALRGRWND